MRFASPKWKLKIEAGGNVKNPMISKISIIATTLLLSFTAVLDAQDRNNQFTEPLRLEAAALNSALRPIPLPKKPSVDHHVTAATHLEPLKTNLDPVLGVLDQLSKRMESEKQSLPEIGLNANQTPVVDNSLSTPLAPSTSLALSESPGDAASPEIQSADFTTVVKDLAYNTLIVLAFGVGFIFVAKVWFTKKPQNQSSKTDVNFDVLSTLKIAPKCNLMLIQIGQDRLVVATDPLGVKSVVRLTDSFGSQLDLFDPESSDQDNEIPTPKIHRSDAPTGPTYSLASIGKPQSKKSKSPPRQAKTEKEIQQDMEAALKKFGLTDLM